MAHLNQLHGPAVLGGSDIRYIGANIWTKIMKHYWVANWAPDPAPNKHQATMQLKHAVKLFGHFISPITIDVLIKQVRYAFFMKCSYNLCNRET